MEEWKTPGNAQNELLTKIAAEYNTLIAGTVGSGKSVLANSIIYNLLLNSPDETQFYFCDPKKVELYNYKDIPHCKGYADDIDSILNMLHDIYNVMELRYIVTRAENAKKYSGSHVYVIIDELADLMTSPKRKQFIDIITRIMQKSRAAKIHIIACTQSPARLVLPAQIQVNFTCRIALHCMNTIESKQAINKPGAEMLPLYGRGIYLNSAGSNTIDIPFTDDIDIETRVNFWLLQSIERQNNKAVADQDINAEKINRLQASRAALNQARQNKSYTPPAYIDNYTNNNYYETVKEKKPGFFKRFIKTVFAVFGAVFVTLIIIVYAAMIF